MRSNLVTDDRRLYIALAVLFIVTGLRRLNKQDGWMAKE